MLHYGRLQFFFVTILSVSLLFVACAVNETAEETDYVSLAANRLFLLDNNGRLLLNLYEYIDEMQQRLETLRRLGKHLQRPQLKAKGREDDFVANPMNSLSLIRQMHADWSYVEQLMQRPVGPKQIDYIRLLNEQRPTWENFDKAMLAMHRITYAYKLKSTDVANGLLDGLQTDGRLSPLDCYEMGHLYYERTYYETAAQWFTTAIEVMNPYYVNVYATLGLRRSNISYMLARSYVNAGNVKQARLSLQQDPDLSSRTEQLLSYYQANIPKVEYTPLVDFEEEYASVCGSSYRAKPTRLVCSYKSSPTPYLRLAPFRMEQLSSDPDIFVFHNVVYRSEIDLLVSKTEESLEATYVSYKGQPTISKYRTSHSIWLPSETIERPVNLLVRRIQQRMADLSDLVIYYPVLEMMRYGFGGHYSHHHDYFNDSVLFENDRIATILLYLNDVPSGGGTTFPTLDLTVQPEPGKVLFWYNLRLDTFDFETRNLHSACPVKIGTKLIMTQWINEHQQMFVHPCLDPPIWRE